jgi:hypothetical protein
VAGGQVLVHGDAHEMMRLKSGLAREYEEAERTIDIRTPKNCEDVELHFRGERMAKARVYWWGRDPIRVGVRVCGCARLGTLIRP